MNKPKDMLLRAFDVCQTKEDITQYSSDLLSPFSEKLEGTVLADRLMSVNKNEDVEDVISYYESRKEISISGVILRITRSDDNRSIPDSIFTENKIAVRDLEQIETEHSKAYRSHHYFYLTNEYLITAGLPRNHSIERLQTYVNWLLQSERGDNLFVFTPITTPPPEFTVSDIERIVIGTNASLPSNKTTDSETTGKKLKIASLDAVKSFFKDKELKDVDELLLNDMVSAELFIRFVKPKGVDKDHYNKIMGTYLKTICDTDDVAFKTKKGGTIKAEDILKTKNIQVEMVSKNEINEKSLYQQMEQFIYEIKG